MRTMVLALVVLVAFIVLTPTARAFIAQTEQQRRVEAEHAAVEVDVERLEGELGRWADPSYVQAQARQRLAWVMPGEVPFRVVDPETVPVADGGGYANLEESVQSAPQVPWYLTLRESVVEAGRPTGEEEAATVPVIRP
jgi:cell division protein FtsB